MREELPEFDFADDRQFARFGGIVKRHRDAAARARAAGKPYPVRVTLARVRDVRSGAQNAYLWAVVYPYAAKGLRDAWGEDTDSYGAHGFLTDRLLKVPVVNRKTGEVMGWRVRSTTELDTAEFAHYVDQIVCFCAEQLGTEIPPPSHPYDGSPPPPVIAEQCAGEIVDEYETDDPDARDREIETLAGTPRRLT